MIAQWLASQRFASLPGCIPGVILALLAWPLAAQYVAPSKAFLEKNGFYLESAGFRVRLANDEASRRALNALPPHRFVVHKAGGVTRYVYADPGRCNCIFTGDVDAYKNYRDILAQPLPGADDVSLTTSRRPVRC
ncbi:hypothetical protein V1291_001916 [Nitrobacteraceae bacterium AZCC 1564]